MKSIDCLIVETLSGVDQNGKIEDTRILQSILQLLSNISSESPLYTWKVLNETQISKVLVTLARSNQIKTNMVLLDLCVWFIQEVTKFNNDSVSLERKIPEHELPYNSPDCI